MNVKLKISKFGLLGMMIFVFSMETHAQNTEIRPGFILPQMTTTQRITLSATNGMLIFDTNTQSYWFRENGNWTELPKSGSTTNFWQQNGVSGNEIKNTNSGGFWSANPTSLFNFSDDISNPPTAPVIGAGTRLMWIPSRSALRVGTVSPEYFGGPFDHWNAGNIGLFSVGMGYNTRANQKYSISIGNSTTASGESSLALGVSTTASGLASTAIGFLTTASGVYSIAMGVNTTASGYKSFAIGDNTSAITTNAIAMGLGSTASGIISLATGDHTVASGYNSTAMGYNTVASGFTSTALGYQASTNGKSRSFAIGGHSSSANPQVANSTDYQMMMAFHNYRFWTQNTGTYVDFGPSGEVIATGAYYNVSDLGLKDFKPLINSLSNLLKTSAYHYYWKTDTTSKDLQTGVIAQELKEIFPELVQKDEKGLLSVNYIGLIPHLVEAVKELKKENDSYKNRIENLEKWVISKQQEVAIQTTKSDK